MSRTALILGAGPNIGAALSNAFSALNYKIALASRSADASADTPNKIHVKVDLSHPESVKPAFEQVEKKLGVPSVVVYNAAAVTFTDANHPLDAEKSSLETYTKSLHINHTSVFAAAQAAVEAWSKDNEGGKTFVYTGNGLNSAPAAMPQLLDLGTGKSASAHLIKGLAQAYGGRGWKFYYADERKADGSFASTGISGEAAAEFYPKLAERQEQGEWEQTFVLGKGYVKF